MLSGTRDIYRQILYRIQSSGAIISMSVGGNQRGKVRIQRRFRRRLQMLSQTILITKKPDFLLLGLLLLNALVYLSKYILLTIWNLNGCGNIRLSDG